MIDRITEQPFCQTDVSGSTFINADCFDVFPFIDDKSIDAIICDLPYGTTILNWDKILPITELWKHYNRILKDNGVVVLFGSQPFTTYINYSNLKMFKYEWIWIKNNSTGFQQCNKRPLKKHETISVFYNKQPTYNPQGLIPYGKINKRGSKPAVIREVKNNEYIQEFTNYPTQLLEFAYDKEKLHPTQKPVALCEYLIKTYTNEGDTVLDNTMGSGTTILAAIKNNRIGIGIEKEKEYYDVAVRRASEYCH